MSKEAGSAVAGAFWTNSPVIAITSSWEGKVNGQIAVTAVTSSIVHEIPRLLVGIWKANYTHEFITKSKAFTVHLLRRDQIKLVKNFGFYTGREREKFENIDYKKGVTGSPVLLDAHSYAECRVLNAMDGGDMTAFLVSVEDGEIYDAGPWMTLNDFYTDAPPEWIAEYGEKLSRSVSLSIENIHNINHKPWQP
ncbi:MAG: flavin reductase [Thermodesulfobacteriales bacterium]|nr:MAG: flavin reductase [Thermodesulfobacteriales bacterium]